MSQFNASSGPHVDVNAAVAVTPFDRIRWGPILAGVFAALATLTLLTVLGSAIGLTAYDANDTAREYKWGFIIWGIISVALSFFIGGRIAAYGATTSGRNNGTLHGALVWAVAIPLTMWLLAGAGLTTVLSLATASAQMDNRDRPVLLSNIGGNNANAGAPGSAGGANTEEAARRGSRAAWGTLISLALGLAAASFGGLSGSRDRRLDHGDTHAGGGNYDRGGSATSSNT